MNIFKIISILSLITLLANCSTDTDKFELKSPCVSNSTGDGKNPCEKRPVNQWQSQIS